MPTSRPPRAPLGALLIVLLSLGEAAVAATPVYTVRTDLKSLIRAAADTPVQFAVLVPHSASIGTSGAWSVANGRATWSYAVQVPTAVSMSFHAVHVSLPESAALLVRGTKTTTSYRARDVHRGELWSRIQPGDALQFTLTVETTERDRVALDIVSLQAGYRSLGPGVEDHPYYRQLKAQLAAASGNTACVTNYECQITATNTPPGSATAALTISNLYECTGVLINDVPSDNTPYLLTARHCESGHLGGGNPGAASTVTVYWDATSACNATLGSIYDPDIPTQTGAQTVVEQEDAWLIKLDVSPVVSDAQFAGFDASGGAVQGGYTIHHAEGYDKQFTAWYGQAAALQQSGVLGVNYVSDFLETVNQIGNIGPGASGSGLFDQNDHLVGSLSLGRTTTDPSGYGACPVAPLSAPNGSNGVADFTSLAGVWNSTADTTSSTGSTTLKSVLDPANTGILIEPSVPAAAITFSPLTTDSFSINTTAQISWSAPNATQCTASGGVAGDGWSGTLPTVGTQPVTETTPAVVTYTLTCSFSGGRIAGASLALEWVLPTTSLQVTAPYAVWTSRPAVISWVSNNGPCSITGGGLSLTNLAASGSTTTTQATAGDVTYTVTCGPANNIQTSKPLVMYVTPSLVFVANSTDRLEGQPLTLLWNTYADECTPSGGAPNDGWSTTAFKPDVVTQFSPQVTALGTYTYTFTCSSGPLSLTQSVVVTIENNAPFANASVDKTSVVLSDSPADYMTMSWISNLSLCTVNSQPFLPGSGINPVFGPFSTSEILPQDSIAFAPTAPGTYVVSVTCTAQLTANTTATSTPITLTVLPPPAPTASISLNPSTVLLGQNFTISWSSTNALGCTGMGGGPGSVWGGGSEPPAGSTVTGVNEVGQYVFGVTCKSIDPNQGSASAQATLTVASTSATLTASPASLAVGNELTLTWSSTGTTACTASGGGANGTPWTGTLGTSGTVTQTATSSGSFTYMVTCTAGSQSVQAQTTVTVATASGGGGGHGGGGALGLLELGSLATLLGLRRRPTGGSRRRLGACK